MVRMFRSNYFVNFRHVVSVISIIHGNMSRFYCTAGRGTETFACSECKTSFLTNEVSAIDGKVFFTCNQNITAEQINRLKTVERIFVRINYLPASEIIRTDKHAYMKSLCEKLLNKDDVITGFHTYRQLFAISKESDCDDEPVVKKVRYEQDDEIHSSIPAAPTFRISCKISGRFKGSIHTQHLSQKLGAKVVSSMGWKVDLKHPQIEICVHINDEHVIAGIPTSKIPVSKRNYIAQSGLRSTISWIICHLADIRPGDVVLDPMCGKATILVEGALLEKTGVFWGCDNNPDQLKHAVENMKSARLENRLQFVYCNSLELPFRSSSIDRVVCDAPFGHKFTTDINLRDFYIQLLKEILRVLKCKGKAVVMTSSEMRLSVLKQLNTCNNTEAMTSPSEILDTPSDNNTHTMSLDGQRTLSQKSLHQPVSDDQLEEGIGNNSDNSSHAQKQNMSQMLKCSQKPNTESADSESDTKTLSVPQIQSDSCNSVERETFQETRSSGNTCDTTASAKSKTSSVLSGSSDIHKEKETSNIITLADGAQLVLLEDHYVKLGETPAHIIVMQKQSSEIQ